jgi:hypothetical protein
VINIVLLDDILSTNDDVMRVLSKQDDLLRNISAKFDHTWPIGFIWNEKIKICSIDGSGQWMEALMTANIIQNLAFAYQHISSSLV